MEVMEVKWGREPEVRKPGGWMEPNGIGVHVGRFRDLRGQNTNPENGEECG
jgi:hypothetical protein